MAKDFKVKVFDGTKRAESFMKVFGRLEVCVLAPIPILANVPEFDEPQPVYMLDFKEITADERARLVDHISNRFGLGVDEVSNLVDTVGVPILANECVLTVENPQKWIDLNDDMNSSEWDDDYEDEDWD